MTGLPNKANLLLAKVKLSVFERISNLSRFYLKFVAKLDPLRNVWKSVIAIWRNLISIFVGRTVSGSYCGWYEQSYG